MTAPEPAHRLVRGGSPHNADGYPMPDAWASTPGGGHAKCTCGRVSLDDFPTRAARQAWHRAHQANPHVEPPTPPANGRPEPPRDDLLIDPPEGLPEEDLLRASQIWEPIESAADLLDPDDF